MIEYGAVGSHLSGVLPVPLNCNGRAASSIFERRGNDDQTKK
jgi:hypothetical protein